MNKCLIFFLLFFSLTLRAQRQEWVLKDERYSFINPLKDKTYNLALGFRVTKLDKQTAFYSNEGKIIADNIDDIDASEGFIRLTIKGKMGLLDYGCKTILPFEYDYIWSSIYEKEKRGSSLCFSARIYDRIYLISAKNEKKAVEYGRYYHFLNDWFLFENKKEEIALLTFDGILLSNFSRHNYFFSFLNVEKQHFIVFHSEEQVGLFNHKGKKILIEKKNRKILCPSFTREAFVTEDSIGYSIDLNGNIAAVDFIVEKIVERNETMIIREKGKYGLVSKDMKYLIEPKYKKIDEVISNNITIYKANDEKNNQYIIDIKGNIIAENYNGLIKIVNNKAYYNFNGKLSAKLIDGTLSSVFDPITTGFNYSHFEVNHSLLVVTTQDLIRKIYTSDGKFLKESYYESHNLTQKGGLIAQSNKQYGYYNSQFELKIPFSFDNIYEDDLKEFLIVKSNNRFGLFDLEGNQILEPIYEKIHILDKKLVLVEYDNKFGLLKIKKD